MNKFTLEQLAATIAARAEAADPSSYTASLLAKGTNRCAQKFGEEAVEAVIAACSGDRRSLAGEAADVVYHLLVLLRAAGIEFDEVKAELERRTKQGGLEEKASRGIGSV